MTTRFATPNQKGRGGGGEGGGLGGGGWEVGGGGGGGGGRFFVPVQAKDQEEKRQGTIHGWGGRKVSRGTKKPDL